MHRINDYNNVCNVMKIPGLSFSPERAIGITKIKQKVSQVTAIPLTKQGLERKVGGAIIKKITRRKG